MCVLRIRNFVDIISVVIQAIALSYSQILFNFRIDIETPRCDDNRALCSPLA